MKIKVKQGEDNGGPVLVADLRYLQRINRSRLIPTCKVRCVAERYPCSESVARFFFTMFGEFPESALLEVFKGERERQKEKELAEKYELPLFGAYDMHMFKREHGRYPKDKKEATDYAEHQSQMAEWAWRSKALNNAGGDLGGANG